MEIDSFDSDSVIGLADWLASSEAKEIQGYLEDRIVAALFSHDPSSLEFQRIITQLAWIGSSLEAKPLIEREILALNLSNEISVEACNFFKGAVKVFQATSNFISNHAWEIGTGVLLCATGFGIAYVTGYAISASIGGVVVAGAGSIFTSSEEKSNPNVSKVPLPNTSACSKEEAAIVQQSIPSNMPKVELPSSVDQVLVTATGVWAGGNYYPAPTSNGSSAVSSLISSGSNNGHLAADWKAYATYDLAMQLTQNSPHQPRGENALALGQYTQAVHDFNQSLQANPVDSHSYLQRGAAHFHLKEYDRVLQDYQQSISQEGGESDPFSISEFGLAFTQELQKGAWEAGEGVLRFIGEFANNPVQTSKQIFNSINTLIDLARRDEWGEIAQALSPELHELVTQWDGLSTQRKGELAGYAIGKHGADILIPGALAKIASRSVKSAQELVAVCRNIQIAQDTLLVEAAAGIGNAARIDEIIQTGQRTVGLGEQLGLTSREMGQLKQAGKLETTVSKSYDGLSGAMQESCARYKEAQNALKPYAKKPMPEFRVRELIHETGIPTFPRPKGIPENYLVMISDTVGMEYVHPTNAHIRVRVMPGVPHSPNPMQQKPYVIQQKNGKAFDIHGNLVETSSTNVHIPLEEFVYRE